MDHGRRTGVLAGYPAILSIVRGKWVDGRIVLLHLHVIRIVSHLIVFNGLVPRLTSRHTGLSPSGVMLGIVECLVGYPYIG